MTELTLLTMPVSTNRLYAGGKILSKKGRENKTAIGWEANAQFRRPLYTVPLRVEIDLFWPDARRRDLDNIKGLLDALTGVVWEDDSQIVELHIRKSVYPGKAQCVVKIYEAT